MWLCSHVDTRMYHYEAIRPTAIRLYEQIEQNMKIYNSMATIIAIRLHSYMAAGLMATWQ